MASYYGYTKREADPIDWSKGAGGIVEQTYEIEAGREEERQELDKIVADNDKIISSLEQGQNDTFNDFEMRLADGGRDMIYDTYNKMRRGEISPSEYKRIQQTQMNQWGQFATSVKTYNERMDKVYQRAQTETSSGIELWNAEQQATIAEVDQMGGIWKDGKLYLTKIDEEGKVIDAADVIPVSSFNQAGNLFVDRVNVEKAVAARTKDLAVFKKVIASGDIATTEGKDAMENYEEYKKQIINSLTGAPVQTGSILVDEIGGYEMELGDGKYKEREADKYTIMMTRTPLSNNAPNFEDDGRYFMDNGNKVPIGPWQKEQAENRVGGAIDAHVGYKETARTVSTTSTKGGKQTKVEQDQEQYNKEAIELYEDAHGASTFNKATIAKLQGETVPGRGKIVDIIETEEGASIVLQKVLSGEIIETTDDISFKGLSADDRAEAMAKYLETGSPTKVSIKFNKGRELTAEGDRPKGEFVGPKADLKGNEEIRDEVDNLLNLDDIENEFVPGIKKFIVDRLKHIGVTQVDAEVNGDVVTLSIPGLDKEVTIEGNVNLWASDPQIDKALEAVEDLVNTYKDQRKGGTTKGTSR